MCSSDLARNGQGGVLLVVVLDLQRGTVGHQRAVRQTDTQGGADLRTFNSKAVVVRAVNVTGDHQVVLKAMCSTKFATLGPPFRAAACHHAEQTISSPSYEGLCASGRLAVLPFGIVVTPSGFPAWFGVVCCQMSTEFTQFFY